MKVSAMSRIRRPSITTPLPSTYVRSVLAHIGQPCGALGRPYTTTPFWSHAIADWVMGQLGLTATYISFSLGGFLVFSSSARHSLIACVFVPPVILGLNAATRKRALKKRAAIAKAQ